MDSADESSADDADSADAFYKFTLAVDTSIEINTDGSAIDTVIAVYDGAETSFATNYATDVSAVTIGCDNDSGGTPGASKIVADMAAGTYYLVVKNDVPSFALPDAVS